MSYYFISMPEDKGKKYEQFTYPAGETQIRLMPDQLEEVVKHDGIVLTARITDGNPFQLVLLFNALSEMLFYPLGLSVILPYMPYSRADRRFTKGDCFALQEFCEILQNLCAAKIVTFDVHSKVTIEQLAGERLIDVGSESIINDVVNSLDVNPTILLPDEGSLTRYDQSEFGHVLIANCKKHRDGRTGKLSHFEVPHIETPTALIVDDICDGGATFIGIAQKLKEQQPDVKLYLYVSHGIFSKGFDELRKYFEHIYTTDSVYGSGRRPYSAPPPDNFVTFFSIDGLLKASFLGTAEMYEQVKQ